MKRLLTLALVLVLSFNLAACSKPSNTTTGKNPNWSDLDSSKSSSDSSGDSNDESATGSTQVPEDVTVEDLEINWQVLSYEGDIQVYTFFTFTNNSPYPIIWLSISALLKDTNTTEYYATDYTVLPGETSTTFHSYGPNSGNPDDIKLLSIEYTVYVGNDQVVEYEYDYKLNNYSKWDSSYSYHSMDIELDVNDFSIATDYHSSNNDWDRYLNMTYANNSDYPITRLNLFVRDRSSNSPTYFSCSDTVMPGETSPAFRSYNSPAQSIDDLEFLELELVVFVNGSESYYNYDYKLQIWKVL
ncbi:MAG: hypothetical protein LBG68_02970 [Coriobacteriales bacterium]|jgi:hypothetical protein|nr:hypothetical protein [Coriobacteriales bacterium]